MSSEQGHDHLPIFRSPLVQSSSQTSNKDHNKSRQTSYSQSEKGNKSASSDHDNVESDTSQPQFRRYSESTHSELFYDLFFVANLTVFTAVHEVNDSTSLQQYIGFFAVIWLTWYQVSLYDVRFSVDSVLDRIAKALQFGVMIGFAIVGPQFNVGVPTSDQTEAERPNWMSFRALSIILMVSRLVLVWQYLQALWFTRAYKNIRLPLASIAITYAIAAFVYLGLFFTFSADGSNLAFIAWYVVAVTEGLIATLISSFWRVISFKGTHLVQRMGLLTLIFLGEGVIGAARRATLIFTSTSLGYSAVSIGNTVALILILYFLYMLYFDWVEEKHFGTIRQQVWAYMHFPLHLCLVVALEGASQVLTWSAADDAVDRLADSFNSLSETNATSAAATAILDGLKAEASGIVGEVFETISYGEYADWLEQRDVLNDRFVTSVNATASSDERQQALIDAYVILSNMVYNIAGFNAPERHHLHNNTHTSEDSTDPYTDKVFDTNTRIYKVFELAFAYFFIATGLVVILIGLIALLSKTEKQSLHWIRLGVNLLIGIGLCCVASIAATFSSTSIDASAFDNFAASPWMLPTAVLALFAAVSLNNVNLLRWPRRKRSKT